MVFMGKGSEWSLKINRYLVQDWLSKVLDLASEKQKQIPQVSIFCFSEKLFLYDLNFLLINLGLAVINAGQKLAKEYQLISVRIVKIGLLKQAT